MRFRVSAVGLSCAALLAACGGGGGGDEGGTRQTIAFDFPGGATVAVPPEVATSKLKATASSGGPVTFTSNTPEFCTVNGDTLSLLKAGECSVTATQAGHNGYAPVSQRQLFVIPKRPQTITRFRNPGAQPLDANPVMLEATSSLNRPVTFSASPSTVCTVNGSVLTKVANGMCVVTATQEGGDLYESPKLVRNIPIGTEKPSAVTYASGFKDASNTKENGAVALTAGASEAGWWCNGLCEVTAPADGNSLKAHFKFQLNKPADGWMGGYFELFVNGPGVRELSTTGNTAGGLRIDAESAIHFSFAQNPEWFSTTNNGLKVGLVLGHLGNPKSDGKACNVTLEAEVKPSAASATSYSLSLKDQFKVAEACGLTGLDPWNELQDYPISRIKFAASSLNVSASSTGLEKPTYPTTLTLTGPITFQ